MPDARRFRKTLGGYEIVDRVEFDFPEIITEDLMKMRMRLLKKRRRMFRIRLVLFVLISAAIILTLIV